MRKYVIILLLLFTFFSGCSLFYSLFFKDPEILGIRKVSVSKVNLTGAVINVTLSVLNENGENVNILKCDYSLYVNDAFIGKGFNKNKQILKANDTSDIVMPLEVKASDLTISALQIFKDIIDGKELLYRVEGEVTGESEGIEVDLPIKIKKRLIPEIL